MTKTILILVFLYWCDVLNSDKTVRDILRVTCYMPNLSNCEKSIQWRIYKKIYCLYSIVVVNALHRLVFTLHPRNKHWFARWKSLIHLDDCQYHEWNVDMFNKYWTFTLKIRVAMANGNVIIFHISYVMESIELVLDPVSHTSAMGHDISQLISSTIKYWATYWVPLAWTVFCDDD